MAILLLVGGVIVVLAGILASLIAHRIQKRGLEQIQAQQQAWERAQEARQQQWKLQQEQHNGDLQRSLHEQMQHFQEEQALSITNEALEQQSQIFKKALVEYEIGRARRIEDIPLPRAVNDPDYTPEPTWRPAQLEGADLSNSNLASRYLRDANLRGAVLAHANLFMADLQGADLAGADLSETNLCGANLTGANLQHANLTGANLLVADLKECNLSGAILDRVFHLAPKQLDDAYYDDSTRFEHLADNLPPSLPMTPLPVTLPEMQAIEKADAATHPDTGAPYPSTQPVQEFVHHNANGAQEAALAEPQHLEDGANPFSF